MKRVSGPGGHRTLNEIRKAQAKTAQPLERRPEARYQSLPFGLTDRELHLAREQAAKYLVPPPRIRKMEPTQSSPPVASTQPMP